MAKIDEALEMIRSAEINLDNMVKMMPVMGSHPLLPLVKMQHAAAIEALEAADDEGEGEGE